MISCRIENLRGSSFLDDIRQKKLQEPLAKDTVKAKTTSQIAEILGVSKSMASKIANLAPGINAKGGKINIAKL